MTKLTLGLDIGIASVGWGIIDEDTGKIVDTGVRLFNSADANNNATRRQMRGARRLIRRKKHRLERIKELLKSARINDDQTLTGVNPYELRVKGLTDKLELGELHIALMNLAKHRGITYLEDIDEKDVKQESLKINQNLLENEFPCQIQLNRFQKYGRLRGVFPIGVGKEVELELANIFPTSKYVEEAQALILTQMNHHNISVDFSEKYIAILSAKRPYYIGPGNEKSRSDYGIYKTNGDTLDNLFETLIGKCTIYNTEIRASRASYTAQEFNLLNDLNNLTISGEKLSLETKQEIINEVLSSSKAEVTKIICRLAGCKMDEIKGFRIDKNDKPEFHSFKIWRKMCKEFQIEGLNIEVLTKSTCDVLGDILTLNTEAQAIRDKIKEKLPNVLTSEMVELLIQLRKKNQSLFSGWHSLSFKAMNEVMPELYETSKNQMQILTERGAFSSRKNSYKNHNQLPASLIVEDIYNPVVRRATTQAIKIVNAIIKKYGNLNAIIIEMAREDNLIDAKKNITTRQKKQKGEKDKALIKALSEYDFPKEKFRGNENLMLKIRLWYQQDGRCIYNVEDRISISDLVDYPERFEIDHIIPKSVSFNDGFNNKVLCCAEANQRKGQKTPFAYYKSSQTKVTYQQFKANVLALYGSGKGTISKTKKDFLLEEADINKWEVRQQFISRNLNDTRYASRVVLNSIQDYMQCHGKETSVYVIRGQFTSQLRNRWSIGKNRDESFSHHGIDALIVAATNSLKLWKKASLHTITEDGRTVDQTTGEILPVLTSAEYSELVYQLPFDNFKSQLANAANLMRYSHKVDRKINRSISDATIYSTRVIDDENYIIGKIKNIYDDKEYASFLKRYKKDKKQFLMYHNDRKTFEILEQVLIRYQDQKNPFRAYLEDHNEGIRKYSRKGNGPVIVKMKYLDKKLGKHINLTMNYNQSIEKSRKTVLRTLSPYRTDVYYNPNTKRYGLVGIKHCMFKFTKDGYVLNHQSYEYERSEVEGLTNEYHFMFSLNKNDIFRIKEHNCNEFKYYRFLSKNETSKNLIEVKPEYKPQFDNPRERVTIKKDTELLQKINTDILGAPHIITKEKLKTDFRI